MAINKNHEFEDLTGIKCAVVEKNASQERVGEGNALVRRQPERVMDESVKGDGHGTSVGRSPIPVEPSPHPYSAATTMPPDGANPLTAGSYIGPTCVAGQAKVPAAEARTSTG